MTRGKHADWCRIHASVTCNCSAGTVSDSVERDKEIEVDRVRDATVHMIHARHCHSINGLGPCNCIPIPPSEPFGPSAKPKVTGVEETGPAFQVFVGGEPDQEKANKHRFALQEALRGVCLAIDAAAAAGFVTSFQLGLGPTGRQIVAHLSLAKHF